MTTGERAKEAVRQPGEDLNLVKDKIPPKLLAIQDDPYRSTGMRRCGDIAAEVAELDAVLGADVDSTSEDDPKLVDRALDVGGGLLSGIIPFRGVIREVTGANATQRRLLAAYYAGVTRRSFLKGLGQAKGCRPPAAPLPAGAATER